MPLSRYQIRNEYNLADPELYKVADKDDPEALLEGVAMAGLVGVLRQLGDLAQFAAEVFHDLHEEVMATAARGHGLIVRVQQLEAEFPSVERTLLSQTTHTAFLYNSGIDWHQNPRMDENVVTRGDLPRFVMDSYEECRGPPRLFLLDKFDVAGAGACLKRFTDPSFFKAEATSSTGKKLDGQREKRTRRVKRRGPRWRNEATPETFPSSHAKLHQLFLEELIETGGNDPDRRVKLKKRQFTGSLFSQEKRNGYMEKFLESCSPEQRIVHEVCIDALPLTWTSDNDCESGLGIVEIGTDSPRKESEHSSPDIREMVVRPSLGAFNEGKLNDITEHAAQGPRFSHDTDDAKASSASYKVRSATFANRQSQSEVSNGDGDNSDDGESEVDNYMDALANMESEIETESECSNNQHYLNLKPIVVDSDASEGLRQPSGLSFDSQSLGNSAASEDGHNFFTERQSSSRSMSVKSQAESTSYHAASVRPSKLDVDNRSLESHSASEDVSESKTEECRMKGAYAEANEISKTEERSDDVGATQSENPLPSSVDELCFAEPDIVVSETSYSRHDNQTNSNSLVRTVPDAPERRQSGHLSSAQPLMHDLSNHSSSVCSESLVDPEATHDSLPPIEHKDADSAHSNKDQDNAFDQEDESATSDPNVPDFRVTSKEDNSDDQYSGSVSGRTFNDQEQSEIATLSHTPSPYDAEAAASLPSSQGEYSIKDVAVDVEDEEKASSAPFVCQSENSPLPISSELQTHASELPFSGTTNGVETAEHGSLEAAIAGEVSWAESNGELPSKSADAETVAFDRDVCEDVTSIQSNEPNQAETPKHLDNMDDDRHEAFSHDEFPCDGPSRSFSSTSAAAEGDSCQLHGMERLEHKEASTGDSRQLDVNGYPNENSRLSSSSSLCPEKVQGQPVSCTEDHYQSDLTEVQRSCSQNLSGMMIPQEKGLVLHNYEPLRQPLLANPQIQTPECINKEENSAALHDDRGMSNLLAQPGVNVLGGYTNHMAESTTLFSGYDNVLSSTNQTTQVVDISGQPIQTAGFPALGMLPAEPQINLDSPPLPPLPPMQWRLSRFQSSSERHMVQQLHAPVQPGHDNETDPSSLASNAFDYPGYSNDSAEIVNLQPLPVPASEVSLEIGLNEIQKQDLPVANSASTMSLNGTQMSVESLQSSVDYVEPKSLVNHPSGDDSLAEVKVDGDNDIQNQFEQIPKVTEQAAVSTHVPFQQPSAMHYEWQPPPSLMAPEARRTWLSPYDGMPTDEAIYANGAPQKKPPRPRNPLIDEVVAIDKSKLRKVERVKPSTESKSEGGESFLEQLQLRKVERVEKPSMDSKTQEGESLLEQLQLRKVGERVKPAEDSKSELKAERELPLEHVQLRKVGERVKSESELKAEEMDSLRVQLRKTSERVKLDGEQRPEETESPKVQLRKVSARVKQEVQQKPEETESPRVQLRKVSETVKQEIQQKPEETESPRVQLRRVGEMAAPSVAPKTEDRDSILEQIRNKSFSLKPAVATRPNIQGIQGPRTNLKVAAIIEKASTIRQAMAGSDEDEEDDADNWSDS